MGLNQSTRCILWAAEDGRLNDLLYHLDDMNPRALEPSSLTPKKQAPIHLSAARGHTLCIQALVQAGSKLNGRDGDGYTPLHLAVANGHYSSAKMLLELGAKVDIKTRFDITPLHIAASIGHVPCIKELVRWGANLSAQESWGQTPLIIATLKKRVECMRTLVHLGANPEIRDHLQKQTALHIACSSGDEESVLILLDGGADVTAVNNAGQSSLGMALASKFYSVVPLLIEYGARLNEKDRERLPLKLQAHIDSLTGTPLSLLQLCRIEVRQMYGPETFDAMLPTLNLPGSLAPFMTQILEVCDGTIIKEMAVRGLSEEFYNFRQEPAAL